MLNFTFFSSAYGLSVEHNCHFIELLISLLVLCIVSGYIKRHNIWIRSLAIMLVLWFTAGLVLYWTNPNNFITDWINTAVAIGTIGAVITTLYLNALIKRDNLTSEKKKVLFLGMEIITLISNSDKIYDMRNTIESSIYEKLLTEKITEFCWEVQIIFTKDISEKLISPLRDLQEKYKRESFALLKRYCKNKIDTSQYSKLNQIDDYKKYYDNIKTFLDKDFFDQLSTLFKNSQPEFKKAKISYLSKAKELIANHK